MSSPTSEITLTVLNTESMTETIHGERRTTRWTTYVCLCGDGRITKLTDDEKVVQSRGLHDFFIVGQLPVL